MESFRRLIMKLNEIKLLEATNLLEVKNFEDFYGGKTKFFVAVWHKRAPFSAPKGTYFGIGLVGENNTKVFDRVVDALYDEHQGMVTIRHVDDNDDVSSQLYLDIGKAKTDAYTSAEVFTDEKSAKAKVASWMKEAANRQVTDRAGTVLPIEIKPKAGTEWAEAHAALFKSRAKPSGVPKVKSKVITRLATLFT